MDKKMLEAIARLIQKQVKVEVAKQTELIRAQIISEVAGMLNYSERKLLSKLNEAQSYQEMDARGMRSTSKGSDFERSMKNLGTMEAYKDIVSKVETPTPRAKRKFVDNPMLNDILNETPELSKNEMADGMSTSVMDIIGGIDDDVPSSHEPWTNENKVNPTTQRASQKVQVQTPILGTDNRPINMSNDTVKNVLNILNNTNFKEKYDELAEKGNAFRDSGAPAPRYNSEYFKQTMVD